MSGEDITFFAILAAVFIGVGLWWGLHPRYIRGLAGRIRRRLGLEQRTAGRRVVEIGGTVGAVALTLRWSEIRLGRSQLDILALFPDGVGESLRGLADLDRSLPFGVRARREGDAVRIHLSWRDVVVFPTKHICRWAEHLVALADPGSDESSSG